MAVTTFYIVAQILGVYNSLNIGTEKISLNLTETVVTAAAIGSQGWDS